MIIKNWRERSAIRVHGLGLDWKIMINKKYKNNLEMLSKINNDLECACLEIIKYISLAKLKPGLSYKAHSHNDHEEIYYIIKGKGEIIIDNEESSIKEGDCIYIPINSVHQIINNSDGIIEFLAFAADIESK